MTRTSTPTYTDTMSPTLTWTYTLTRTATPTLTSTPTYTDTLSPTWTWTQTSTRTVTPTYTITSTFTVTRTYTNTATPTSTRTNTPTFTVTPTATPTSTNTPTFTFTFTFTVTPTPVMFPYLLVIEAYNEAGEKVRLITETRITDIFSEIEMLAGGISNNIFNPSEGPLIISIPGIWTPEQMGPGVDRINIAWDGYNDNGQNVNNGVYYIKISVQDRYGHLQTTIKEVQLLRIEEYVRINIYNTAGELVRGLQIKPTSLTIGTLNLDNVENVIYIPESGMIDINYGAGNIIQWDGKNGIGELVNNGMYEMQIEVFANNGYRIVASKTVTILREQGELALIDPDNPNLYPKIYPNPVVLEGGDGAIKLEWFKPLSGQITVKIYNVAGELIKQIRGDLDAKVLNWDLKTDKGEKISGGLYITVFEARKISGEKEKEIKKFSIIRKSTSEFNIK